MTNQGAPEALRLRNYVERRKRAKQLDVNKVHAFDAGCGSEAELLLSDIETLLSLVEAQQPAAHVQKPAEIEHVAGDVSKNGTESNMTQQPATSEQQPFGWIKQSEIDSSNAFGGSINLWRRQYDCDVPVYLAQQPAPSAARPVTPQADSQPAHQWGTGYPPLPAAYYLAGGVVRTWDEGQMRAYVDADRTARAPADPAGDNFGSAEHWKEKAQYWAAAAHRMRQEALRGEPVDGIVHPKADSALEDAARYRHLRDCNSGSLVVMQITGMGEDDWHVLTEDDADAVIDAAMKAGGAT